MDWWKNLTELDKGLWFWAIFAAESPETLQDAYSVCVMALAFQAFQLFSDCSESLKAKKNPLCFYTNVPSLNKLEEYVNFTDCLKIWPEDCQDTNQKKLEKWISTRACDVMCIGKILISKLDRQVSKHPIRILKNSNTILKTNPSGWKLSRDFTCAARFDMLLIH